MSQALANFILPGFRVRIILSRIRPLSIQMCMPTDSAIRPGGVGWNKEAHKPKNTDQI